MVYEKSFSFRYNDVRLFFGVGIVRDKLYEVLDGCRRALLITSRSAARVSGALGDVIEVLRKRGIEYVLYDKVVPNPYASIADEAGRIAIENSVDTIIAVGGGSVIDVAKVVSVIARTKAGAADIITGRAPIPREGFPRLIAINLTHGTGSEVDRWAVLTIDGTFDKRGSEVRYPDIGFDDPIYLKTLNRDQTIYTSLDAFYHAYESATSSVSNQFTITLAREAIEIIRFVLPEAIRDLSNIVHRSRLLYASMIAGICIDLSGTHLNHLLEHPISGLHPEIPHGAGLAMLGPMVVYYTHKALPEISTHMLKPLDPGIRPVSGDCERAYRAVKEFQESIGFSKRLGDYGLSRSDVEKVVEHAMRSANLLSLPFTPSADILRDIVLKSL